MAGPRVGLYLRLSRDDGDREESMSIFNQRAFLLQYADRQGFLVVDTYIDDGYTGTNFDRPDFQRLLHDINTGRINTVVTKDLSRLGRDVIGTMHYYQIHFPKMGVRYISAGEGIDTAAPGGMGQVMPFLAAANDFYTADISRKVRAALTARKQSGLFIGAQPPLGYRKDPQTRGRLLPDPLTAPVIHRVFQDYLAFGSVRAVARGLTQAGISTPAQLKGSGGAERCCGVWSDTMVRRILTNPTYAGHLTQNRSQKINYKVDTRRQLPPQDWIVVPNSHSPLVTQEAFDRVQALLQIHSYCPRGRGGGHLLTGMAFCGDCGAPMTYVRESETRTYMVCQGYRRGGGLCTPHRVREDRVLAALTAQLQALTAHLDLEALVAGLPPWKGAGGLARSAEQARRRLEACGDAGQRLYTDRAAGLITQGEFDALFQGLRRERARLERHLQACTVHAPPVADLSAAMEMDRLRQPDRATLAALVERVVLHQGQEMEVYFRFRPPE